MLIRQQAIVFCVTVLLSGMLTGTASADLPMNSGSQAVNLLPDFVNGDSNEQNTSRSTITISEGNITAGDTGPITDVFFTLEGLVHSNLSDLTVRVEYFPEGGPSGAGVTPTRIATLFERVGISDGPDDNSFIDNQNVDGTGSSANLDGTYRFRDGGTSLFDTVAGEDTNFLVPTLGGVDDDFLPVYAASGAGNGLVGLTTIFGTDGAGNALTLTDILGTYDVTISDRSNQTTNIEIGGQEQSFTQTNVFFVTAPPTEAIPEPATASGMLLALIGLAARRRRV